METDGQLKLLPCPFCHAKAILNEIVLTDDGHKQRPQYKKYYVTCIQCGIGMPIRKSYTRPLDAVDAWNTRYDAEGRIVV